MFSKAIVRRPSPSLIDGLTTADLGVPDYQRACAQHVAYIAALERCGLEVMVLPADESFPDSVFVEDVALLTRQGAIITRPGAPSRRGETAVLPPILTPFFTQIEAIQPPGTLEAGDVMMVGDHFYIGLSERTNQAGAEQLIHILAGWGLSGSLVQLNEMLHLKTGVAYLEQNRLLVAGEFVGHAQFASFEQLVVPPEEQYAANCIWVNGRVIMPAGFPQTESMIAQAGYEVIPLAMSEFQKLDGGVSCLSLRF